MFADPVERVLQASTCIIIFAALLSVIGIARGTDRELLFPIVTHVGHFDSVMFVLNPTEYRVTYRLHGEAPGSLGITLDNPASPMPPHSMRSFRPDGDINPVEYRGGWGSLKYRFLEVPPADKERVKNLRLLAWTELRLSELSHRPGPINLVTAIASIPAVEAALEFKVPGVFQKDKETAIAILNPSKEPIRIDVILHHYREPISGAPDIQVTNTLSLPPMQRLSGFLRELMSEGKDNPLEFPLSWAPKRSILHIRGSAPIAVGALLYYRPGGVFGNLPVVRVGQ